MIQRGDIYWAAITPRSGSEQSGHRPVLIVSHNGFNQTLNWKSLNVLPISTSIKKGLQSPTIVTLPKGSGNLPKESIVLCHQVTTLDRSKIQAKIGILSSEEMRAVERGLMAALDLL